MTNIPGNHEVKELQKTAILGTAHILQKVLTKRYNGVNAGTTDIRTMNSYIRIVAMFPRDMVCLRNISVDTLHERDNNDDDDDDDDNALEWESKSDTSNNRDDWNHFKITRKTPEQNTRRA
jgi:hypothetical protein